MDKSLQEQLLSVWFSIIRAHAATHWALPSLPFLNPHSPKPAEFLQLHKPSHLNVPGIILCPECARHKIPLTWFPSRNNPTELQQLKHRDLSSCVKV